MTEENEKIDYKNILILWDKKTNKIFNEKSIIVIKTIWWSDNYIVNKLLDSTTPR